MNTQKTQTNGMSFSTMILSGVLAMAAAAAVAVTNRKKLAGVTTKVKDAIGDALGDAALAMDPTATPAPTTAPASTGH